MQPGPHTLGLLPLQVLSVARLQAAHKLKALLRFRKFECVSAARERFPLHNLGLLGDLGRRLCVSPSLLRVQERSPGSWLLSEATGASVRTVVSTEPLSHWKPVLRASADAMLLRLSRGTFGRRAKSD